MLRKSTWLHLRIPFSFFLLPVYLFALAISPNINESRIVIVFAALHLFLYPASNGYNSYFDKDKKSIGGLKHPPKVTKGLYYTSLLFDIIALSLGLLISWQFASMLLIYGIVSKAYSHPSVRLKKYPWVSWFIAGLFQGAFTFIMAYMGINDFSVSIAWVPYVYLPALLTSLMLWGSYPMTQIYQHDEDIRRGDITLSYKLGIRHTFHFTGVMFLIATIGFMLYFFSFYHSKYGWYFFIALTPVVIYFIYWYYLVNKSITTADYSYTMRLNFISALCLSAFFIYFFLDSTQLIQALKEGI